MGGGGGGCCCCCCSSCCYYSCSWYSHSRWPPRLFSASHPLLLPLLLLLPWPLVLVLVPLGLRVCARPPFLPFLCSFVRARARSCLLLSPSSSCCRRPHGPSHGICIKYIVSIHPVVILLTFKIRTIHLNMKNWLVFNTKNCNLLCYLDVRWEWVRVRAKTRGWHNHIWLRHGVTQ
jgi:hypothetical protein